MRSLLLSLTLLAGATTANAQSLDARFAAEVERVAPAMVELRHDLHQHPELANRETRTAAKVAEALQKLGLEVRTGIATTGVVATLRGGKPGPFVAVRADMDALPVTEAVDLPWKSTARAAYNGVETGVMHACGHDVHTAALLGLATALTRLRAELPGTVQFIFQPAEEGPPTGEKGGAEEMLAQGIWKERTPDAVFGLHTAAWLEVGTVGYAIGPALSATDRFELTIKGKQAHGASPHLSVDPVVTASQTVLALQTIRSRNLGPLVPGLLTVGIIRGGDRFNIIPGEVRLEGTIRSFDGATQDLFERRVREIVDGTTRAAGATFDLFYLRMYPVTKNDTTLTRASLPALERALGPGRVRQVEPWSASEDFSFFANRTPGFFFFLGSTDPRHGSGGHHTPTFRADDRAVALGMRTLGAVVLDFVARGTPARSGTGAGR